MADGLAPEPYTPNSADVLTGGATVTNSTSASTLITVPAGRTWQGSVAVSLASTAAAVVGASVDVNGTNAVPASGTVLARVNVGGLTSGGFQDSVSVSDVTVVAPPGNAVTVRLVNTSATTNTSSASAVGVLK